MRCHKIKKLLYLTKSELTEAERDLVQQHLAQCAACRLEVEQAQKAQQAVQTLKRPPVLHNAPKMSNDIMRAVRKSAKPLADYSFLKKPAIALTQRRVQFAMGAAILLFLCLFGVQEAMILHRLYRLEERMARQGRTTLSTRSPLAALQREALLYDAATDGDKIIVDKQSLEKLLKSYGDLQVKNDLLFKLLQKQGLAAAGISLDDGLTLDEVQRLLADPNLLQKLYNL